MTSINKFFVQYADESTERELHTIQSALNKSTLLAHTGPVVAGDILAAPYTEAGTTQMCRVRVMALLPREMVEVYIVLKILILNLSEVWFCLGTPKYVI